jgi:hypothetical protein
MFQPHIVAAGSFHPAAGAPGTIVAVGPTHKIPAVQAYTAVGSYVITIDEPINPDECMARATPRGVVLAAGTTTTAEVNQTAPDTFVVTVLAAAADAAVLADVDFDFEIVRRAERPAP